LYRSGEGGSGKEERAKSGELHGGRGKESGWLEVILIVVGLERLCMFIMIGVGYVNMFLVPGILSLKYYVHDYNQDNFQIEDAAHGNYDRKHNMEGPELRTELVVL
jgi:hypothetical protein